ncbi:iron-containing alcohol dehydrogenase [Castellaniella sp. GW247-6E4]|uniref:iron-containing alcohol dehydrogenase n=1 Tax=Castellaniella sp. GW247-6E4 TaxID=3140380 RepID=UPI003314DA87
MENFGIARAPGLLVFGSGRRDALASVAATLGERALVCTDSRYQEDSTLRAMVESMRAAGIRTEVYDGTIAELPLECIEAAVARARTFGPDMLVGLGGGSCIDLAKLVGVCLAHGGPLSQYYGEFRVPGPIMPVIAIPTTAGTGSEVTPVAVLADPGRAMKVGISSPYLVPAVALCDPELTLTCPPSLTAGSGADALTHAIEAFTTVRSPAAADTPMGKVFVGKNLFSDLYARMAIEALAGNLARAVEDGQDLQAREQVMLGSLAAGMAFAAAGTAAAHAIQYPVGALTHTAHGPGVAALLPYVMEFNRPACIEEFAQIADLFEAAGAAATGGTAEQRAARAIDLVEALFRRIGIPASLEQLGLAAGQCPEVAEQSLQAARLVRNNPRPLDPESMKKIVASAHAGRREQLRETH